MQLAGKGQFIQYSGKIKSKEHTYIVFAKSFSQKIKEFDGKKVYCFDLKEMEEKLWED